MCPGRREREGAEVTQRRKQSRQGPSSPRGHRRGQGELEALVLSALRQAPGPVTAGWVQERLGMEFAYTTVMTILTRLHTKGVVSREREGRAFAWLATSDEAGLAALRMRRVLDSESDRGAVLARFVTGLSSDDEVVLRELLREAAEEPEE
ncbi:BlaI/MecI/CopY family transcriptional regulator [Streptomyces armeniacus]|uniref:BlaI/MecI/CopY family transcriptional regulator n=1 Tax=Streptomyces armeniacus TaxID=83291 RepID=A0A345XXK5_9ACTN|nr:BlaI/MecI/CopY family transcriptional regulator [Streptomyces armeniacus]AXK36371.1 BlaI/MecI/CopY family transcriptional regulator [Streptomyces armeniacus]